jgi:hypothetical protein
MTTDLDFFRDLEEGMWRDDARAAFDGILSHEFTDFCRFGHVYDRDDLIGSPGGSVEVEFPFQEFEVERLADTVALVTYVNTVTKDGVRDRVRRSSIWVNEDDTWKLRFVQATTLSNRASAAQT